MKEYPNFFETLEEAHKRLNRTIICYEGKPMQVFAITDHMGDGHYRIYIYPVELPQMTGVETKLPDLGELTYAPTNPQVGKLIDEWIVKNPKSPMMRKKMNSPHFNKYRPFELGMCNYGPNCYFIERQPQRKTEQGLIRSALQETPCSLSQKGKLPPGSTNVQLYTKEFADCVTGNHPNADEALKTLTTEDAANLAVGFHRNFAMVRGPIGMLFLAYKTDVVGVLPNNNLSAVKLGKDYKHVAEVTDELKLFNNVTYA